MGSALLLDIGSTYTKARAVDLNQGRLLGASKAKTTVDSGVEVGIKRAAAKLPLEVSDYQYKLACSSAAGGLEVVAIGLVPELTAQAARQASLGAGAKLIGVYSYQLSPSELAEINDQQPDVILLAGGTDGGNEEVIIANSKLLAESELEVPIIVAGNKVAAGQVKENLEQAGKDVTLTANVMPEVNKLEIEPARQAIREVFLAEIIQAKGLARAEEIVGSVIMPTPAAVMEAVDLIAQKTGVDLMAIDIGGATTDVYSAAAGQPTESGVTWKGLEEPYLKRTVEGDIGLRYSADGLLELSDWQQVKQDLSPAARDELASYLELIKGQVDYLPANEQEAEIDLTLGQLAARTALKRHAGQIETVYTPVGTDYIQRGKDLQAVDYLIGTGGLLSSHQQGTEILQVGLEKQPKTVLLPANPEIMIDSKYLLAAIGLLQEVDFKVAFQLAKQYIIKNEN